MVIGYHGTVRIGWLVGCGIVVAGCGRLAFDADTGCVGHDEDGDGIADVCDGCPHLADSDQVDSDGDGVNDPCDPDPLIGGDRIVRFDPFTEPGEWSIRADEMTYTGDALRVVQLTDGFANVELNEIPSSDRFEFGGRIVRARAVAERQLTLYVIERSSENRFYYCELYDVGGGRQFFAYTISLSPGVYDSPAATDLAQPLDSGPTRITMVHLAPQVSCRTNWPTVGNGDLPFADIPAIGPMAIGIGVGGLEVELDYFVQIRSE